MAKLTDKQQKEMELVFGKDYEALDKEFQDVQQGKTKPKGKAGSSKNQGNKTPKKRSRKQATTGPGKSTPTQTSGAKKKSAGTKTTTKNTRNTTTKTKQKRAGLMGKYMKEYLEAGGKKEVCTKKYKRKPSAAMKYAARKVKARKKK